MMALAEGPGGAHLALANVEYTNAEPETYVMPLALGSRRWCADSSEHAGVDRRAPCGSHGAPQCGRRAALRRLGRSEL